MSDETKNKPALEDNFAELEDILKQMEQADFHTVTRFHTLCICKCMPVFICHIRISLCKFFKMQTVHMEEQIWISKRK